MNDLPKQLQAALDRRGHTHRQACDEIGVKSKHTFENWLHGRWLPSWEHAAGVMTYVGSGIERDRDRALHECDTVLNGGEEVVE